MAETSGFFDAVYDEFKKEYDLEYVAEQFANYFSMFIKNGVFGSPTNQLRVASGDGMTVVIMEGNAFISGYWYNNDEELSLSISSNTGSSDRTDSIILRLDHSERKISALYMEDSTDVIRTDTYYDLKLAEITVHSGASQISDSDIKDTRTDESVCGFVTQLLNVQTTEDLFAQYNAAFNTWFDSVKGQLSGDLAAQVVAELALKAPLSSPQFTDSFSFYVGDYPVLASDGTYLTYRGANIVNTDTFLTYAKLWAQNNLNYTFSDTISNSYYVYDVSESSGVISYKRAKMPTSLPASDVYDWAKSKTKPEYTKSEVGLGNVDNTADSQKRVLSASKLTTARKLGEALFDGSQDLSLSDMGITKIVLSDTVPETVQAGTVVFVYED